ncbi:MAG: hypothetical protein LC754_10330 [Acidobacteria bacterium]|nr:hypothetical protein [Acidobacteriota bacterium]
MTVTGYSQGAEGYIGISIAWRPGSAGDPNAFVAPADFLLAESKKLDQQFSHIEHDAYVGSRDTDRGHRHGKADCGGPFTIAMYPDNGLEVWEASLGFRGTVAAIASDTTTAIQNGPLGAPASAPTAAGSTTGGTIPAGTYQYAVTATTKYGETPLGPATGNVVLTGATSSVVLTAIPTGGAGTTGRNIYRNFNGGAFGLIASLTDNTTATYTDTGATAQGAAPPTADTSIPQNTSVLALTTGNAGYNTPSAGRPVLIDAGLKQEIRQVLDYDAAGKLLYVGLLGERDGIAITHTSAGTTVVAPQCYLERPIQSTDFTADYTNLLPTIAAEDNIGNKYSWQYRGGYVKTLNIKSAPAKTEMTCDVMFNKTRVLANGVGNNPAPTAFNESQSSLNDLSFEYQDGFLALESDPNGTGTPLLQRMNDAISWEVDINNNLKKESTMDGTIVNRYFPGAKRKIEVKFDMLNAANYPVIYQNFLSRDVNAKFFAALAINTGTPSAPAWKTRMIHCPNVRYIKSVEKQGLTDTTGETVDGVALRAGGKEKIYVYSLI